jgi:hypothetical protein
LVSKTSEVYNFDMEDSMNVLDTPIFSRIRRNHGLEHATINVLSEIYPYKSMAGYSYPGGFLLIGDIPTENLREAAGEALARLNNGERQLAIHANCGTNFAVSGFLGGFMVWLSMAGAKRGRDRAARLPTAIMLATLGFILGQSLGPRVQERITTSGYPQGMVIEDVFPVRLGRFSVHQVVTRG